METPSYIALSRLSAMRKDIDIIANNVANVSTTGYRGERTIFQEYLQRTGKGTGRDNISMTQDIGMMRDTRPGPLQLTGNPLDLAINGNAWFVLGSPAQDYYTRTGTFQLNADRQIVSSEGYPLLGENGAPIVVPANTNQITIDGTGQVATETGPVGRLQLVRFADQQAMRRGQGGLYATDQQPQAVVDEPIVVQGGVEGSNVQAVLEITRMMSLLRDYQSTQKLMESESDRMRSAITRITKAV